MQPFYANFFLLSTKLTKYGKTKPKIILKRHRNENWEVFDSEKKNK